jgi:hypothetical protein
MGLPVRIEGLGPVLAEVERLAAMTGEAPKYIALELPPLQFKILGWLSNGTSGGVQRSGLLDITPPMLEGMKKAWLLAFETGHKKPHGVWGRWGQQGLPMA